MINKDFLTTVEEVSPEEARSHLQRILASPAFRASKRSHRFLAYVVEEFLAGNAGCLKERALATHVFDRADSWESSEDTIVRVGAREVRKRLAQYYTSSEGAAEPIRIELPLGSYVPEFVRCGTAAVPSIQPVAPPIIFTPAASHQKSKPLWLFASAAVLILLAAALPLARKMNHPTAFEEFWSPVWNVSSPVLIAIADPLVYHVSSRAIHRNDQKLGPTLVPSQRPIQLPASDLDGSDIIPVPHQYVGYGDTVAAADIAALLAKHSAEARLRPASKLEFNDFRDAPAALIGAFTNQWALEFTQRAPFHFGYDPFGAPAILEGSGSRYWSIPSKRDDGTSNEDYFLIGRFTNSPAGQPLLLASGLAQFGTEAAGRFLVDTRRLEDALKKLTPDWKSRNLEIVLHAKVIGNAPSASEVIAWKVW